MAIGVVEPLEVVHVDQHQREILPVALELPMPMRHFLIKRGD